jgi:hypothetical protein
LAESRARGILYRVIALILFLRPTLLKFLVMGGLIAAALTFHFLTLSPYEGSVREGPISTGTKFARIVGRRLAYTGIYRDIVRKCGFYFQPTAAWESGRGFVENPTAGARFMQKHLPNVSWELPGKIIGLSLGAAYFYLLACLALFLIR